MVTDRIDDGSHGLRDFQRGFQTKQEVKGAAGGMRGVDYLELDADYDDRRTLQRDHRVGERAAAIAQGLIKAAAEGRLSGTDSPEALRDTMAMTSEVADALEVVPVNALAAEAEQAKVDPAIQKQDERIKRKLLLKSVNPDPDAPDEDDDPDPDDPEVEWVGPFADEEVDDILKGCSKEQIARLIMDPMAEMRIYGTLELIDPQDMREALRTPLRVARHLSLLAGRLLASGQFSREDVVRYLAGCFINLGFDFGRPALRNFATSVGINAVYPLEVLQEVCGLLPAFVPRTTLAPFITGARKLRARAGKPLVFKIDPTLKVTAFALKGGGEPGYQLAPCKPAGEFALRVLSPGTFTLLLAAVDPHGFERVQELSLVVEEAEALRGKALEPIPSQRPSAPAPAPEPAKPSVGQIVTGARGRGWRQPTGAGFAQPAPGKAPPGYAPRPDKKKK